MRIHTRLSFYRVIQKYRESGVTVSSSTINDWFNATCARLKPLYDWLRTEVMQKDYIQVDENALPVIDNEKHRAVKGYIWCVRDVMGGGMFYHYDMGSRSQVKVSFRPTATMPMVSSHGIRKSHAWDAGLMSGEYG